MKQTKKNLLLFVKLFLVSAIFITQGVLGETDHAAKMIAPTIRLAIVAPTTGNWGNYGTEIMRGAQVAIDQLNQSSGPIELIVEDACLAADTVRAARKLIDIDKIQAIVASYCVIGMIPMATITEKQQIIAFHTSAVADAILQAGDFTFTTNITIKDEAYKLAEYAYNSLGSRRAAVLYLMTQWGQDYHKYFVERYRELGGTVVAEYENPIGANDFRTELAKINSAKPDALFLAHAGAELGVALKQAQQLGLNKQAFLGAHEAEEQSVIDIAGKAAEGFQFLSPKLPDSAQNALQFRADFKNKYGHSPGVLGANAFDATTLTVKLLRECNLSTTCVKDKLYQLKNYPGVSGEFSITAQGGTIKSFTRKVVKDGKFQIKD